MSKVVFELDPNKPLTSEEKELLEKAKDYVFMPDEDSPELSETQIKEFKRLIAERRAGEKKQTVSLRLTQKTLNTAKALSSSYTSVLANVLEKVFKDPEALKKYLQLTLF